MLLDDTVIVGIEPIKYHPIVEIIMWDWIFLILDADKFVDDVGICEYYNQYSEPMIPLPLAIVNLIVNTILT